MNENLSVKDIAALAGVSVATVSRVINQNGRFSKETEARVRRTIEEYGYRPNLLARGLRTNKVQMIGVIVPDITNEYFAKITLDMQKRLFEFDYSTIICNTNEIYGIEMRHLAMLKSLNVSGLIHLTGIPMKNQTAFDVPTVYIDREPSGALEGSNCVLIESNNEQGGYLAAREMLNRGCKHIALIEFKNAVSSHISRAKGYERALRERGIPIDSRYISQTREISYESGYRCMKKLLQTTEELDGVFCTTDMLALGALKALGELGIQVPSQVKLVGFDDTTASEMARVPITTIRQPVEKFGSLAISTLLRMINGEKIEENRFLLPVHIVRRETTSLFPR